MGNDIVARLRAEIAKRERPYPVELLPELEDAAAEIERLRIRNADDFRETPTELRQRVETRTAELEDAADEIERLREALGKIIENEHNEPYAGQFARDVVRDPQAHGKKSNINFHFEETAVLELKRAAALSAAREAAAERRAEEAMAIVERLREALRGCESHLG
jgi:hypothetical protein